MLLSVKAYAGSCFAINTKKKKNLCFLFPIQNKNIIFPLASMHINTFLFVFGFALRKQLMNILHFRMSNSAVKTDHFKLLLAKTGHVGAM